MKKVLFLSLFITLMLACLALPAYAQDNNILPNPVRDRIVDKIEDSNVNNTSTPDIQENNSVPLSKLWEVVLQKALENRYIDTFEFERYSELAVEELPVETQRKLQDLLENVLEDQKLDQNEFKIVEEAVSDYFTKTKAQEEQATTKPGKNNQVKFWNNINWEMIGVVLAIIGGLAGYFFTKKKQKSVSKYFNEIDDTYSSYKMKGRRCEAELYRMKDIVTEEFKKGKMDESSFSLLEKRIDDYLKEIREQIISEKFGGMPSNLKNELSSMLSSGDISKTEYEKFKTLINKSAMGEDAKKELGDLVSKWEAEDEKH